MAVKIRIQMTTFMLLVLVAACTGGIFGVIVNLILRLLL
jgi:hypothetical protein